MVIAGIVFSCVTASPISSFTRGASGAIYASDIVGIALALGLLMPNMRALRCQIAPGWYRIFFCFIVFAVFSAIFIAPFYITEMGEVGLAGRAQSFGGIPLRFLISGFRTVQLLLYVIFFMFAARLLVDKDLVRFTQKCIVLGIAILAVMQIITFLDIKNMGLALPWQEYQQSRMLGHSKAAAGRLYVLGIFTSVILLYRKITAPLVLGMLVTIIIGLLASGSRAAFLGLLVGTSVFFFTGRLPGLISSVVVVILLIISLSVVSAADPERIQRFFEIGTSEAGAPRWLIWQSTLSYIRDHFYILFSGVGFVNFRYALIGDVIAEHGHNDFLTALTELGFIGFALFVVSFMTLAKTLFKRIFVTMSEERWEAVCLSAVILGLLITSLFESTLYFGPGLLPMQRIVALLFGTATARWIQEDYFGYVDMEIQIPDSIEEQRPYPVHA